jgi:8-demethyl-8-alpha-L-rhamnosyltetracenomycin-C 2'-O-methyltransferase
MTLDEFGRKYGTDKASGSHNYLQWYETFFQPIRYKSFTFVEIGVASGASIKTWRDYFPHALIIGMDIQDKKEHVEERVRIALGDQADAAALDDMLSQCNGPPSVINDDAGHNAEAQLFSYKHLVPKMSPGGLYVLEDIGSEDVCHFLMNLALRVVRGNLSDDHDEWIRNHGNLVETVNFYRESVITKLKGDIL